MDEEKSLGLSLIIPCFNERENISILIKNLEDLSLKVNFPIEIIIVDGNSDDGTDLILQEELSKLDSKIFSLILLDSREGYGFDIQQGLSKSKKEILAWTHADLQTDVKDVEKAFNILTASDQPNLIIKGKRKNRHFIDSMYTLGMQIVVFFYLKTYLDDINGQPKLFKRDFYKKYLKEQAPKDFSLDLYTLFKAKKNGHVIKSFPVYFNKRKYGEAKGGGGSWRNRLNLIKRTFRYIRILSKV